MIKVYELLVFTKGFHFVHYT